MTSYVLFQNYSTNLILWAHIKPMYVACNLDSQLLVFFLFFDKFWVFEGTVAIRLNSVISWRNRYVKKDPYHRWNLTNDKCRWTSLSAVFLFANSLIHIWDIKKNGHIYSQIVSFYLRIQYSRSKIAGRIYRE